MYFPLSDSCYHLTIEKDPVSWLAAEAKCEAAHAHLVSIESEEEMTFLHYQMTTRWKTNNTMTMIGKSLYFGFHSYKVASMFN